MSSTDTSAAASLFREGHMSDAIEAAAAAVRQYPGEAGRRLLLAEYLLFSGAFERADNLLAGAEAVNGGLALVVAEFRQLLRAALGRERLRTEGQPPEFLDAPTESQAALLRAAVLLREGDRQGAAEAAAAAEAARRPRPGLRNGRAFEDFRDADDLIGGNVELLTTTGRFFWIDLDRIVSMSFHKPERPRDLFWRRCTMSVRNGPDGDVYLPAIYDGTPADDDGLRLGRTTAWSDEAPVRGSGQRVFLVGDEGVPFHELGTIEFEA